MCSPDCSKARKKEEPASQETGWYVELLGRSSRFVSDGCSQATFSATI